MKHWFYELVETIIESITSIDASFWWGVIAVFVFQLIGFSIFGIMFGKTLIKEIKDNRSKGRVLG